MPLHEQTRDIFDSMPLASLAILWEWERSGCEVDAQQLAGRRARNRDREKIIIARLAERGGFLEVPGYVLTVSADGRGIQRTRVVPHRAEDVPR